MPLAGDYEPSSVDWVRAEVEHLERTGGSAWRDRQVVLLTTVGARTGRLRKTPLMRVEHDGAYALVASMGGAPKHPVWYWNLKSDAMAVMIQDGPEPFLADVRELTGDEKALWWERAVAAFPPYAEYQQRTERLIPVFVAHRRDA